MNNKNKEILGIIGLRSGSKGLPGKNIIPLLGKPLAGWIIDTAKKSTYINRIIVSTDSQVYADIAVELGAETPCLRPKSLSSDGSHEVDYVRHMLNWLDNNENYRPDIVVRMLATCPMQSVRDIDASIKQLKNEKDLDSVVVVSEARQHPMKALKIVQGKEKKSLVTYFSESGREITPIARQSYEKAYFRSNVITFRTNVLTKTNSLTGDNVGFQICDQESSVDIDSEFDFEIAEFLLTKKLNS